MNIDAKVNNEIFRKNHPIILATNRHLATLLPVRLKYDAGGYLAGRVLGRITATGFYKNYDFSQSDGSETAAAVLFEDVPVELFPSSTGTALARGIFGGEVFKDKLIGLDASGETNLGARTIVDADSVTILKF